MSTVPPQLDSRVEIVTPENIAFGYLLAGPFRRLPAYLIDCALCALVLVGSLIVVGVGTAFVVGPLGIGVWLVVAFIVSWFYFGLFETFWNGQTPGKRLMGLRVLSVDGRPINAMQAIMRNLLRGLDAQPMLPISVGYGLPFYMVALASAAANNRYQRLGDWACGTIVVVERRSKLPSLAHVARDEVFRLAAAVPVHFAPSRSMAQALSVYVARREMISPARRAEIASALAEPLAARFGLPQDTDGDLLLCALYYRAFVADGPQEAARTGKQPVSEVASA